MVLIAAHSVIIYLVVTKVAQIYPDTQNPPQILFEQNQSFVR